MKKLLCYLLIVWFAVVSGSVGAHGLADGGHAGHDHSTPIGFEKPAKTSAKADVVSPGAQAHDACAQSHCSHGHNVGVTPTQCTFGCTEATNTALPAQRGWQSVEARNDIERPKWLVTTPAVVSLLA